MYRALYDFQSKDGKSLSFCVSDIFTVMEVSDPYWWLVQDGSGQIGYVPANYLVKEDSDCESIVQSVDRAIDAIHFQVSQSEKPYSQEQKSNIRKLIQHRKQILKQYKLDNEQNKIDGKSSKSSSPEEKDSKWNASSDIEIRDTFSNNSRAYQYYSRKGTNDEISNLSNCESSIQNSMISSSHSSQDIEGITSPQAPPGKCLVEHHFHPDSPTHSNQVIRIDLQPCCSKQNSSPKVRRKVSLEALTPSPCRNNSSLSISESLHIELAELVRRNTGLSHDKSKLAVMTVLSHIRDNVPHIRAPMDSILQSMYKNAASPMDISQDAKRLKILFDEMSVCVEDSQQRSWALHEDESNISSNLEELLSILMNAEAVVVKDMVSQENYSCVHTLVLYYQMESRKSIRMLLLSIFVAFCALDSQKVILELLQSVLPLEIARDIQSNARDTEKVRKSSILLTMIFSSGESVPAHHYEYLSRMFITYLLNHIENPLDEWEDEKEDIIDLLIPIILSFNLHFHMPSENPVMSVFSTYGNARTFTEKLMVLVNRGEDPVRLLEFENKPPDSLLKFLSDLYSSPETSSLLYSSDAKVLVDIIVRQLSDLCPGDKMRTEYLALLHLYLKNSDYEEHNHRLMDLQKNLSRIFKETDPDTDMDRLIIKQIFKEFSDFSISSK